MTPINPLDITNGYQLVALIVIMLPGLVAAYIGYKNSAKLDTVHSMVNGQQTALNKMAQVATSSASFAEGRGVGVAEEREANAQAKTARAEQGNAEKK
jgi:hypothetical protein